MKLIFFLLTILLTQLTHAEIVVNSTFPKNINSVKNIKVSIHGYINEELITKLITLIDDINFNIPQAKNIYLFINSGNEKNNQYIYSYTAYNTIKKSKIPITTVNTSQISGSANLLYCASKKRLSYKLSSFILNFPDNNKFYNSNPDKLRNLKTYLTHLTNMIKSVYRDCSNFTDKQIKTILYNEQSPQFFTAKKAKDIHLVTKIIDSSPKMDASYNISSQ